MVLDDLIEKATCEGRDEIIVNFLNRNPDTVMASEMLGVPIELIREIAKDNHITLK